MPSDAAPPPCEIIQPLLSVYVDDETTATEASLVEAHVTVCERCASELAFLRLTHAVLSRPSEMLMPAHLSARIAAATYARPSLRQRLSIWLRPTPGRVAALGSAALAAGVIGASILLRGGPAPVAKAPSSPTAPKTGAEVAVAPPKAAAQPPAAAGPKKSVPAVTLPRRPEAAPSSRTTIVPETETRVAETGTPRGSNAPRKKPVAPESRPSPRRVDPVPPAAEVPSPPIAPREVPSPAAEPAVVAVQIPDSPPAEAPEPARVPERTARVEAPERRSAGALDNNGRIRLSRSQESAAVIEVAHVSFSRARGDAFRPSPVQEPGQPLKADVAFVSAPVQ